MIHRRLFCLTATALTLFTVPALAEEDPSYSYVDQRIRFSDPNPAAFSFYGTGRMQFPSLRVDVGSSIQADRVTRDALSLSASLTSLLTGVQSEGSTTGTLADDIQVRLQSFLGQFEQRVRADYELDINLLGFGGTPVATFQVADRPLALGLHAGAETRGYLNAQFSKEFNQSLVTLSTQLPDVFSTGSRVTQISGQAGSVIQQINNLTSDITTLTARANQFFQNPSTANRNELSRVIGEVDDGVDTLIPTARELTGLVTTTSNGARNLLSALKTASGGGIQLEAANDLHLTLGLGASYPIIDTNDIKLSFGATAKMFILPVNVPVRTLRIDSDAGFLGALKLTEVSGLGDVTNLEATLDKFDNAVTSVNTAISNAEKISASADKVQAALDQNNLGELATSGAEIINQGSAFTSSITQAQTDVQQAAVEINTIQRTLINELSGVNAKGTLTTPDGAGFGMDFGIDAVLWRQLRLGLTLQNPIVVWQGTERPFEGRLINGSGNQIAFEPALTIDDTQSKKVAYNATVPLTVLASAQYRFDDVLPSFPGLYANGLFEFVNNGRTPALTLGVQKQWDPLGYVGLGGRIGGISSLVYLETGLRPLQGFGLDFQLGISPLGTGLPVQGLGWLGMGKLGLYWQF